MIPRNSIFVSWVHRMLWLPSLPGVVRSPHPVVINIPPDICFSPPPFSSLVSLLLLLLLVMSTCFVSNVHTCDFVGCLFVCLFVCFSVCMCFFLSCAPCVWVFRFRFIFIFFVLVTPWTIGLKLLFSEALDLILFFIGFFLYHLTFQLNSYLIGGFTLSDFLLDKPWSQVSSLLPPRYVPSFFFVAHMVHSAFPLLGRYSSNVAIISSGFVNTTGGPW